MKKFEVISSFLDRDDQVIESGAVIELPEHREEALRNARVIGNHALNEDRKKEKQTTKRGDAS